jgi:hypothetical protein
VRTILRAAFPTGIETARFGRIAVDDIMKDFPLVRLLLMDCPGLSFNSNIRNIGPKNKVRKKSRRQEIRGREPFPSRKKTVRIVMVACVSLFLIVIRYK